MGYISGCLVFFILLLTTTLWCDGETNPLTIPPYYRTAGPIKWYHHEDKACQHDAKLHCKSLYNNGRLLIIENDEVADLVFARFNLTNDGLFLGLQQNTTENILYWNTCDRLNKNVSYDVWHYGSQCAYLDVSLKVITVRCSSAKPYVCEETINGSYCDMDNVLNTFAALKDTSDENDCILLCQKDPTCWTAFFINALCFLLQNADDSANTRGVMYRKDCMHNLSVKTTSVMEDACLNSAQDPEDDCTTEYTNGISGMPPESISEVPIPNSGIFPTVPGNRETIFVPQTFIVTEYATVAVTDVITLTSDCISQSFQDSCDPVTTTIEQPALTITVTIQPSYVTVTQILPTSYDSTPCINSTESKNYTTKELEDKINEITDELRVDKFSTNSYVRKITSALDNRASAQAIGWTGIVIICVPLCILLLFDICKYNHYIRTLIKKQKKTNQTPVVILRNR